MSKIPAGGRATAIQLAVLVLVVAAIYGAVSNAAGNLARQGTASGFGFLEVAAGFDIIMHLIDYDERASYGTVFVVGLINTLVLSAFGIVLATVLGFVIGIARLSGNWLVARLAGLYIEIFRNIPVLLQIFFWYFAVLRALPGPRGSLELFGLFFLNNRGFYGPRPVFEGGEGLGLTALVLVVAVVFWLRRRPGKGVFRSVPLNLALIVGLPLAVAVAAGFLVQFDLPVAHRFGLKGGMVIIPEFAAMVIALTIYGAAYIAEIVRAGIAGVDRGQVEAAKALGLRPHDRMRRVIIPQALRIIIPPLTSQYLDLIKNTTLATAIAFPDLMSVFGGTVLNQTGQAIEVLAITMAVYLTVSLSISAAMNLYNARVNGRRAR
ncbi:MAG: amino acid ABC transporter permease [Sphingomonadales bacterium]